MKTIKRARLEPPVQPGTIDKVLAVLRRQTRAAERRASPRPRPLPAKTKAPAKAKAPAKTKAPAKMKASAKTPTKAQTKTKAAAKTPQPAGGALRLELQPLMVVRARDGFLRGAADPTVLLAAWAIDDEARRLLPVLRAVVRFAVRGPLPTVAPPDAASLASTSLRGHKRVLLVAAMWEENSGVDVRALASALERPESLHFVDMGQATPDVRLALDAVGAVDGEAEGPLGELVPRGIIIEQRDASRTSHDTWVGAAAVVVKGGGARSHRVSLQSADGQQDWTLELSTLRG